MKKPGALSGALIGVLLTAPLLVVFYLGWKFAGLPFAPFDIFDWLTRVLPGSAVTVGIESMIKVIRAVHFGSTAEVAKAAEQSMAIILFLIGGVVAGGILFVLLRAWEKGAFLLGPLFGAGAGVLVSLIVHLLNRPAGLPPWVGGLWILVVFLAWGAGLGGAFKRLSAMAAAWPEETDIRSVESLDRRRFLIRLGGVSATITVTGAVVGALVGGRRREEVAGGEQWSARHPLPNAGAAVKPAPGTRPEFTPLEKHYRIDINTMPPVVSEEDWRLKIGGLVEETLELALADLRRYEPLHQFITLSCISNPVGGDLIGTIRWTGVSLQKLLPEWKLQPTATHLKISSVDGFYETVALETIRQDERVMLAYAWDGVPLEAKHGFPLRIYIPDHYGMKQPKWIASIEAIDHWDAGYWVVRGWSREARMKATSVIDTVAVQAATTDASGQRFVPVGGIAHAGARGISKVEIQVDNGNWREAQLRTPLSGLTWVIWRYDMPFQAGEHAFTVRCWDGKGTPQIVQSSPPHPNGATGFDSIRATL